MKKQILSITSLAVACAIVCLGQSRRDKASDVYDQLQGVVARQVDATNGTNSAPDLISTIHNGGVGLLERFDLPDDEKVQFLINHIGSELVEVQKKEILVKLLLRELIRHKATAAQLNTFASFLKRHGADGLDAALFASLIAQEDKGVPIFSAPDWGDILKWQLERNTPQRSILTQHLLESAERDQWKPQGTWISPEWTGGEKQEIGNAALSTQRSIIARQYVGEKLIKQ